MAKKKNPEGEKCERKLPFRLTDDQKAKKADLAAQYNEQLEKAVEAKKLEMKKHGAKIGDLTKKVSDLLKCIHEGIERLAVKCVEVKNYDENKIEYWYEGEMLESREMTPAERQMTLGEGKSKKAKPKWQPIPTSSQDAKEMAEDSLQ